MSTVRLRLVVRVVAVGCMASLVTSCKNYSTPVLDEQGKLNDAYQRGAISRTDYDRSLRLQREQAWGSTGEAPPPHDQYAF